MNYSDITREDIRNALERPSNFAYFGDDEDMFVNKGFVLSVHRDSDVLERSNYEVIYNDLLSRFPDDIYDIECNHWAVGWIRHAVITVIDGEGNPTEAFKNVLEWGKELESYPVADEFHYSELEHNEFMEDIGNYYVPSKFDLEGKSYEVINEDLPDSYVNDIHEQLDAYGCCSRIEDVRYEWMLEAYVELGYAVPTGANFS